MFQLATSPLRIQFTIINSCNYLTDVSIGDFTTSNTVHTIINSCNYLTDVSIGDFTTSNTVHTIINSCNYLTDVSIGDFTTSNTVHTIINSCNFITGSLWTSNITSSSNLIYYNDGNVGIGTMSPEYKLHVEGEGFFAGDITASGNITAYFSDNRLKTFISKIENPLKMIDQLNGFYYEPNDIAKSFGYTHTKKEVGLSAQEVQNILPELISLAPFDRITCENGDIKSKSGKNYLTISYERLAPVFAEAIKEINKELEELRQFKKEIEEKINDKNFL